MNHPNKRAFTGVLAFVDRPSDKPPTGARGHKTVLTRRAVEDALPTLVGMAISYCADFAKHDASRKIGVIEEAVLCDDAILVAGYLFAKDFACEIESIAASQDMGLSYEGDSAHIDDIGAEVWVINRVTFTGAALILASKAAYKASAFMLS